MELTRRGFAIGLAGAPFLLKGLPVLATTETPPAAVYAAGRTALHPFLGIQPIINDTGMIHLLSAARRHSVEPPTDPFGQYFHAQAQRTSFTITAHIVDRADAVSTIASAEDAFFTTLVPRVYRDVRERYIEAFEPGSANCYTLGHAASLTAKYNRRGRGRVVLIRASDLPLIASGLDTTDREVPDEMIRTRWFKAGSLDDKTLEVWATHDAPPGLTRGSAFVMYRPQVQRTSKIDAIGVLAAFKDGYVVVADREPGDRPEYSFLGSHHDYVGRVRLAPV